jgi:hypothetical protein
MGDTASERYAVVSCHVERLLDDAVWGRYRQLAGRRPGGFAIASLVRPPDEAAGESRSAWLERARELEALGPFGHHTHWTAPGYARPTGSADTGARVLAEGGWLREQGLAPTVFCGGGWYTDEGVVEACAALDYVDATPTSFRPAYLREDAPRAHLEAPARLVLPSGRRLPAVPTTRSLGALARALARGGLVEPVVHVAFHDTDLLEFRRRRLLGACLRVLARRRLALDLDELVRRVGPFLPERPWVDVARGGGVAPGEGAAPRE